MCRWISAPFNYLKENEKRTTYRCFRCLKISFNNRVFAIRRIRRRDRGRGVARRQRRDPGQVLQKIAKRLFRDLGFLVQLN